MFNYQHLLKTHHDELAALLAQETGKNLADAKGDVWAVSRWWSRLAPSPARPWGDHGQRGTAGRRSPWVQPLGVCLGITPFNFPAMIPLWMFPLAVACGNGFVLKPSEQDPLTPMRLAELFAEAEPQGHSVGGARRRRAGGCAAGPSRHQGGQFRRLGRVGGHVYRSATSQLKRAQCFVGAKNHMVIMPDANKAQVLSNLVGAGSAPPVSAAWPSAWRCSWVAPEWIPELAAEFAKVKPGVWHDPEAAYGPHQPGGESQGGGAHRGGNR